MIKNLILALFTMLFVGNEVPNIEIPIKQPDNVIVAQRAFSMDYRYHAKSVSDIFKDNILLNIAYLDGRVKSSKDINWDEINQPFTSSFTLQPDETFAYHDKVLPEYEGKVVLTTNTNFGKSDGYKTDGYLYGDGVCQLASLLSWAAKDAGLTVKAPSNHDFAVIPEVPKSEGVAIYHDPFNNSKSARQNLYITNNTDKPHTFTFTYIGTELKISVSTIA